MIHLLIPNQYISNRLRALRGLKLIEKPFVCESFPAQTATKVNGSSLCQVKHRTFNNSYYRQILQRQMFSAQTQSHLEKNQQIHGLFGKPFFLSEPVRVYYPPLDRQKISTENNKKIVIYQWVNLINGKTYIGSAATGSARLLRYFNPSVLARNLPLCNSFKKYGHNNFCLSVLEDLGPAGQVPKEVVLEREQFYLDILFTKYPDKKFNLSPTAGNMLGFKHSTFSKQKRRGRLHPMYGRKGVLSPMFGRTGQQNPMFGKTFSSEFIAMQTRDKRGSLNPMFGKKHSPDTLAKKKKLVYVYNANTRDLVDIFATIECKKHFKMGQTTLYKYLNNGLPFKGKIFSRVQL